MIGQADDLGGMVVPRSWVRFWLKYFRSAGHRETRPNAFESSLFNEALKTAERDSKR